MSKKKAAEAKMAAKAAGMPIEDNGKEDVFELQHHHLLRCLEKTTVRFFFYKLGFFGKFVKLSCTKKIIEFTENSSN